MKPDVADIPEFIRPREIDQKTGYTAVGKYPHTPNGGCAFVPELPRELHGRDNGRWTFGQCVQEYLARQNQWPNPAASPERTYRQAYEYARQTATAMATAGQPT